MDEKRCAHLDAYFRACNYLSVCQIYLKNNPLLLEPLTIDDIKTRLLGHWGTSPGLNLIYAHANRLIQDTDANMLYITGPGHGGPALRANVFLEGTMTDVYPDLDFSLLGFSKLMKEFSWPGGVPSHVSPPTPGSIHEGGELGYSLVHAYGAVLDNPDLIALCVVGDGEAETGPLATSWQSNKFINPKRDGSVLPILHLNGYKISGPTVFGRMSDHDIELFFQGSGYDVRFVEGDDPLSVHALMWDAMDWAYEKICETKKQPEGSVPRFPLIVLRTPKGWTGPKEIDGKKIEGTFRSHQVPMSDVIQRPEHLKVLEEWLHSYKPHELFDSMGNPSENVLAILPKKEKRMGGNPAANGGVLRKELVMPDYKEYAEIVPEPGIVRSEATRKVGEFLRDVMKENSSSFRVFCPDETNSNRLNHLFDVTTRMYLGEIEASDDDLGPNGRVMEVLSEHLCQGWLEAYLLTGRHGIFPCYEAFALIVDSMLNQHAKWLKAAKELPWRAPISSLNYLLTSHAWRQDHNGYSHQGPGFIDSVLQKKSSVARIYLPPDANTLLSVMDHCLRSTDYVNLIISGKQPMPQWLDMESAVSHCASGIGVWEFASNDDGQPDIVMASSGDTPTLETLAAIDLLRKQFNDLKIRMVNVVDLFTLMNPEDHPHGLDHDRFSQLFPEDAHVVFAFHGHPKIIHELIYHNRCNERFHVHGYKEEGTTTTPFDMVVCNEMSRFHLAMQAVRRVDRLKAKADAFITLCEEKLSQHKAYIFEHGEDMPEIAEWLWADER